MDMRVRGISALLVLQPAIRPSTHGLPSRCAPRQRLSYAVTSFRRRIPNALLNRGCAVTASSPFRGNGLSRRDNSVALKREAVSRHIFVGKNALIQISPQARMTLGFKHCQVFIYLSKEQSSNATKDVTTDVILNEMNAFAQAESQGGLRGCLRMIQQLRDHFDDLAKVRVIAYFGPYKPNPAKPWPHGVAQLTLDMTTAVENGGFKTPRLAHYPKVPSADRNAALTGPTLCLRVPIPPQEVHLQHGADRTSTRCVTDIYLQESASTPPSAMEDRALSSAEESRRLYEHALTVLESLCARMTFESQSSVSYLLAEGVLRQLARYSWSVDIVAVRCRTFFVKEAIVWEALATWDADNVHTEHQILSPDIKEHENIPITSSEQAPPDTVTPIHHDAETDEAYGEREIETGSNDQTAVDTESASPPTCQSSDDPSAPTYEAKSGHAAANIDDTDNEAAPVMHARADTFSNEAKPYQHSVSTQFAHSAADEVDPATPTSAVTEVNDPGALLHWQPFASHGKDQAGEAVPGYNMATRAPRQPNSRTEQASVQGMIRLAKRAQAEQRDISRPRRVQGDTGLYLNRFHIVGGDQKEALSSISLEAILSMIDKEFDTTTVPAMASIPEVARSVSQNLPGNPDVYMLFTLTSSEFTTALDREQRLGEAFYIDCSWRSPSNTKEQADCRTRLWFPSILHLPPIRPGSQASNVIVETICNTKSMSKGLPITAVGEWVSSTLASTTDVSKTVYQEREHSMDPVALAADLAKRLAHTAGVFPECLEVLELTVTILDEFKHGQRALGARHTINFTSNIAPEHAIDATPDDALVQNDLHQKTGGVFIAIGSNVGDRIEALEEACRAMNDDPNIDLLRTSSLYETDPMYVEDQAKFLNGVCEIATDLSPMDLLDRLQAIERTLGRVKTIDKGPRNIDLDILLYRDTEVNTERLTIPHRLMWEREFVLRPLADVCDRSVRSPKGLHHPRALVKALANASSPMHTFTPLSPTLDALRPSNPHRSTHIMSILNVTPDSFSDGGSNEPNDIESLKSTAAAHIAAGATIIDIGGQSSRPNAPNVTAEEEIGRILPAIEAIKSLPEANNIAISVDTYRAAVAEAAVNAGAHIVNDISAGQLDPGMLPMISRLGCTYIMMHMRGTPATMQSEENCSYPSGLLKAIGMELHERLKEAEQAGVRRWRIVLDPGIGFAKNLRQNTFMLRHSRDLQHKVLPLKGIPWLFGTSRKRFIGQITGVQDARERIWGTAATVTAAVACGADIVRVHDVAEMVQVAKMADAIYRG